MKLFVYSRGRGFTPNQGTILQTRSDIDVMFCLQRNQGLIIDRLLVYESYPQDRINTQVIYRFALESVLDKSRVT